MRYDLATGVFVLLAMCGVFMPCLSSGFLVVMQAVFVSYTLSDCWRPLQYLRLDLEHLCLLSHPHQPFPEPSTLHLHQLLCSRPTTTTSARRSGPAIGFHRPVSFPCCLPQLACLSPPLQPDHQLSSNQPFVPSTDQSAFHARLTQPACLSPPL